MDWKVRATRLLGNRTCYIQGDGPFAVVTPCRNRAFSLWATRAEAEHAMKSLMSCGSDCHGMTFHYIADLGEPIGSRPSRDGSF